MKELVLAPIKETTEDYEAIERKLIELWREQVYYPILRELSAPKSTLQNAADGNEILAAAIQSGRIIFSQGKFRGRFSAEITRELRAIGAKFNRKTTTFDIPMSEIPVPIRQAISASQYRFQKQIAKVDEKLAQILPEVIADKLNIAKQFDSALWKVDRDFKSQVRAITVAPQLTPEQRERIADEWQSNMKLWVQDFTEKEIKQLRGDIQAIVFKGGRYESAVAMIQKSYGVTERKAKFLARQETSLLMTKFKETRYTAAGIDEYIWGCVHGSKNHPVRPIHKALEGKKFRWDNPPVTDEKGNRNNPGQDYNCRCFAKPVVKF